MRSSNLLVDHVLSLTYQQLRREVVEMVKNCLKTQKGNIAVLWPAKVAKINGYPPVPAVTLRIAAVLEELREIEVDGVTWIRTSYMPNGDRARRCVMFAKKGVTLEW